MKLDAASRPRAILFDLDGTLLDHGHAERMGAIAFRYAHGDLFAMGDEAFVALWHATTEKHIDRHFAGEIGWREQRILRMRDIFAHARRPVPLTDDEALAAFTDYVAAYERSWRLFDDVVPCLDALSGTRLGIVTNGEPDPQTRKLATTGILERFETVICSGAEGVAKPAPSIFHTGCARMGCDPADALYVGDRLETDARAARRAGLAAVWLDRACRAENDRPSDLPVIRALTELSEVFSPLRR